MALVVQSKADRLLASVSAAPAVETGLSGSTELPPLPASRTVDSASCDTSAFSAQHWSTALPHGYRLVARRASSPYDVDVLDFFGELAQLEDEYARGLQRLTERLTREQPDAVAADGSGGRDGGGGGGGGIAGATGWRRGMLGGLQQPRPLARSVQYTTMQGAWAATQQAVRASAQAHRALAEEVRSVVVRPLEAAVQQAHTRELNSLAINATALEEVRSARRAARDEAAQYGRLLHRFRREARREPGRVAGVAGGAEGMLLFQAARGCAEAVAEANALTSAFEGGREGRAIDAVQEHEERRLEALDAALSAFAGAVATTGVVPSESAASLRAAAERIDVASDVCAFAATYASAATRAADELRPPSFCVELAAEADGREAAGFWGQLWRPLKKLAASILGDDGRDEPHLLPPPDAAALERTNPADTAAGATTHGSGYNGYGRVRQESVGSRIVEITSPSSAPPSSWMAQPAGAGNASAIASPINVPRADSPGFDAVDTPAPPPTLAPMRAASQSHTEPHAIASLTAEPTAPPVSTDSVPVAPGTAPSVLAMQRSTPSLVRHAPVLASQAAEEEAEAAAEAAAEALLHAQARLRTAIGRGEAMAELTAGAVTSAPSAAAAETVAASSVGEASEACARAAPASAAEETDAILSSVDEIVAGLGGAGLTMAEAVMLQQQVLATSGETDDGEGDDDGDGRTSAFGEHDATDADHERPRGDLEAELGEFASGEWFYVDAHGEVVGPLTWETLREIAWTPDGTARDLTRESWTFMEGMAEWLTADAVPGLLSLTASPQRTSAADDASPPRESPLSDAVRVPLTQTLQAPPPPPPPPVDASTEEAGENSSPQQAPPGSLAPRSARKSRAPPRDSFACFTIDEREEKSMSTIASPHSARDSKRDSKRDSAGDSKRDSTSGNRRDSAGDTDGGAMTPAPPPPPEDKLNDLISPHVYRSRRRKESMLKRRSSSLFAADGGVLAPPAALAATSPPPPPPPQAANDDAPPPPPPPPPPAHPPPAHAPASGSGGHSLLGAIEGFNKEARLRKVRRQSRAFAARSHGRRSVGHGRKSGVPPPPPPIAASAHGEELAGDIASVLARAIMRRRADSRYDEPDEDTSMRSAGISGRSDEETNWLTSP